MADFYIGQGDTASSLSDTLKDAAGAAVDIAGATVRITIRNANTGSIIVNNAVASNDQVGSGSDGSKGKVHYDWSAGQTDAAGTYLGAWTVTYSNGKVQTFPNAGYVLIEITADAPLATGTQFASSTDLARRLGIELTADEHVRASHLIATASGIIQKETRQKIARVIGDTLTVPGSYASRYRLPERPIVSITSVTLDGTALVAGTHYYVDGDELVRRGALPDGLQVLGGWGKPSVNLVVVYTHGYDPVPEIIKAVCLEMVVRAWINPGSVQAEQYGSANISYGDYRTRGGLLLTDIERFAVRKAVARTSGSMGLR